MLRNESNKIRKPAIRNRDSYVLNVPCILPDTAYIPAVDAPSVDKTSGITGVQHRTDGTTPTSELNEELALDPENLSPRKLEDSAAPKPQPITTE